MGGESIKPIRKRIHVYFLMTTYEASKFEYRDVFENKKYAYVSLFGIETLDGLKNEIALKVGWNPYSQNVHQHYGVPQLLKTTLNQFKDIKFSHYGVSSSSKLIDSLLFFQVKNAIICFDDFERLSEKLKIQDVMGLANELKLERNCQVILILDESKNGDENKKKYANYKEKLIDETIKIISVEPLIRANTRDIDEPLVNLMVKFADELEIHNFRFFQKVIKLYKQFRDQLLGKAAYLTKQMILVRILQGYFIEDYGHEFDISWNSFQNINRIDPWFKKKYDQTSNTQEASKENIKFNQILEISPNFSQDDLWVIEFKKWFEQKDGFDSKIIQELIESDLIDDNYIKAKAKISQLIDNYRNYNLDSEFTKNLSAEIKKIIKFETLENIEFYCSLLLEFDEQDEINQIDQLIKEHLQSEFLINRDGMLKRYYWHEYREQKYRKFIKDLLDDPNSFQQQEFLKILKLYIQKGEIAYGCEEVLSQMTSNHLENFVRDEYPRVLKTLSLKTICEKIIELYECKQLNMVHTVKGWLKEIIEKIGKSKDYPQHYINYFTENL